MPYNIDDYSIPFCNRTMPSFVQNLTSSYTNQSNEDTMVATSCIMFVLAAVFFILNLFSRTSDVSAILNPSTRLFLSTSLSLFLPVMSYLFSEAKNKGHKQHENDTHGRPGAAAPELSLRARTILMWMLLVEILRKKVEAILVSAAAGAAGYSSTLERGARIAWLGYLVFYNLTSAGKKALYGMLWVVAASKLVQRFLTVELGKRSFAYGKNPQLLDSYMTTQMLLLQDHHQQQQRGSKLLKLCSYVVMGEEELEKKVGPKGYNLEPQRLTEAIKKPDTAVVTVGKIWELAGAAADESSSSSSLLGEKRDPRLKRLCLSFALYKLLRRRLEDFPITGEEASYCHSIIFRGLCCEDEAGDESAAAIALFEVFNDEVQFLCEYYHSVFPVMLASTFFFAVYYILFPIAVLAVCCLTVVLCSHGDVVYAFHSLASDNYSVTVDMMRTIIICIRWNLRNTPQYLFSTIDLSITILLIIACVYEEIWELVVFLLSNWFMVSLLCSYASRPIWRRSRLLTGVIRRILWVRGVLSKPQLCFMQFSVLRPRYRFCLRRRFLAPAVRTKAVPTQVKKAIMQRLADTDGGGAVRLISIISGRSPAELQSGGEFWWACDDGSVAEIILTWHIATEMLETTKKKKPGGGAGSSDADDHRTVATALSRYCAYLVAFRPELLPDERDWTECVYEEMEEDLKKEMGCLGYYLSRPGARCDKLVEIARRRRPEAGTTTTTATTATTAAAALRKGARLGEILCGKADGEAGDAWRLLAGLWTEVVVYAAAASSELQIKAHREALAQGGEFITVLWAITTHTGIARGPVVAAQPVVVEHLAGVDEPVAAAGGLSFDLVC